MQQPLGRIAPGRFLREYWQKKPVLVRSAMPELEALVDRNALIELAGRDDVESRLVARHGRTWRVEHGPFRRRDLKRLPSRGWTLLVNGVENCLAVARAAQQAFDFIPYARHDDVMISYATPGGSVGPHFDSYDVFLAQADGTRTWEASAQRDLALVENAPLRLLRRFKPSQAWAVGTGDVLYVPARHAHHGIATAESITWSFGCRTPSQRELIERVLDHLPDAEQRRPLLSHRKGQVSAHPGAISTAMVGEAQALVRALRWKDADILRALGEYSSEPRANVIFKPAPPIRFAVFTRRAVLNGIELDLKTRLFTRGRTAFINGESEIVGTETIEALQVLADHRELGPALQLTQATLRLLYRWYRAGYIKIRDS